MSDKKTEKIVTPKSQFFNIASVPLRDAWTDFILSRQAMQCSQETVRFYRLTSGKFITWLEAHGITAPQDVNTRHVRQYLALYADKSDWYLNGIARAIRTLVRFWHREGYLPQPVTFDMPRVRQKRLPFLTAEQVKQVLNVCDMREKAIILFLVDSGLRRREFCNLNRQDIDLQTGGVIVRQGKGKKDRLAVIGSTTRRALLRYFAVVPNKAPEAPAFQTRNGTRFTPSGLGSFFLRLSKRAGIHLTPHALRRTFATLALQGGMDLVSLQTLLGHSDISTTRQYIQWLDEDLLNAHRRASPVDNLNASPNRL